MQKLDNVKTKTIKKFISIVLVFLLISTIFAYSGGSKGLLSNIGSNLKEKLDYFELVKDDNQTKDKIVEIVAKINELKQKLFDNKVSFLKGFINFFKLRRASAEGTFFSIYTNYSGNEKTTPVRFGVSNSIDVDDDGDNDIRVLLSLFPSIERPFAISINFHFTIKRLAGFENTDAFFETYLEFFFPGLINKNFSGDRVRYGYQSSDGEEVPDACKVSYKFIPYFLSEKKAESRISIDPKSSAGKDKLALIFSFADINNSKTEWQIIREITYDPAIKSEVTLGSTDDLKRGKIKIESSDESTVDIYFTIEKDNNSISFGLFFEKLSKNFELEYEARLTPLSRGGGKLEYNQISESNVDVIGYIRLYHKKLVDIPFTCIYVKYIPRHGNLSWYPGFSGWIELNSYDQSVKEIGLCDNLFDPQQRLYFADLPTEGNISWNIHILREGFLSVYVDTKGVSFNGNLTGSKVKSLNFKISSQSNIDFSILYNILEGYFRVINNNSFLGNINFYLDVASESCMGYIEGKMESEEKEPFEINFGGILQGKLETGIEIKSKIDFEITRLYVTAEELYNEDSDLIIHDFELDIRNLYLNIEKDKTKNVSLIIQPITLPILDNLIDSRYVKIDVSSNCSLSIDSCNLNIISESIISPTINITYPKQNQTVSGVVTIEGITNPGDPSRPIELVQVRIGGITQPWFNATGTETWSYVWDTTDFDDGSYDIEARCYDVGGYIGKSNETITVKVDNIPDPTIKITSPEHSQTVSDVVTINCVATPADLSRPIELVQIQMGDSTQPWVNVTVTERGSHVWDTKTLLNGDYKITAKCYDKEDHNGKDSIIVTVDNGPEYERPTVKIDRSTMHRIFLSGLVTIKGSASPQGGRPIEYVQVKISSVIGLDKGSWQNATGKTDWSYDWNTSDIQLGVYNITARSYDGKYYSKNASVKVIVKNVDILNNSLVFEIYKDKSSFVNISDVNFHLNHTDTDGNRSDALLSWDSLIWDASDKSSYFYACFDNNNKSFLATRSKKGGDLEIKDFYGTATTSKNIIVIRVDRFIFNNSDDNTCNLTIQFKIAEAGSGDISVKCRLALSFEVELFGIYVKFNNLSYGLPELHLVGPIIFDIALNVSFQDVTWDIAPDFSWGWIKIGGNGHVFLDIDMEVKLADKFIFYLAGVFYLENGNESSILSWETIDGNKTFYIDANASLGMSDVYLIVGDNVLNISIPKLYGSFLVNVNGKSGELLLYLDAGGVGNFDVDLELGKIVEFLFANVTLQGHIEADIDVGSLSGVLEIAWNESGLKGIRCIDAEGEVSLGGYLKVEDFFFEIGGFSLRNDLLIFEGKGYLSIVAYAIKANITGNLSGSIDANLILNGSSINGPERSAEWTSLSLSLLGSGELYISIEGDVIEANITGNASAGGNANFTWNGFSFSGPNASAGWTSFSGSGELYISIAGVGNLIEANLKGDASAGIDANLIWNGFSFSGFGISAGWTSFSLSGGLSGSINITGEYISGNIGAGGALIFTGVSLTGDGFSVGCASLSLSGVVSASVGGFSFGTNDFDFASISASASLTCSGGYINRISWDCIIISGSLSIYLSSNFIVVACVYLSVSNLRIPFSLPLKNFDLNGDISISGGGTFYIYLTSTRIEFSLTGSGQVYVDLDDIYLEFEGESGGILKLTVSGSLRLNLGSLIIEASTSSKFIKVVVDGSIELGIGINSLIELKIIPIGLALELGYSGYIKFEDFDLEFRWTGSLQNLKPNSISIISSGGLEIVPIILTINQQEILRCEIVIENFNLDVDFNWNSEGKLNGLHVWTDISVSAYGTLTILETFSITVGGTLGEIRGDLILDWSIDNQITIGSDSGFHLIEITAFFSINQNDRSISFNLIDINAGNDITIKWDYMPGQANCVYIGTNSGFEGYLGNIEINNEVVLELDFSMSPGSSFEYRNWSASHEGLSWSKDIYFNGTISLSLFRITRDGETATVTGALNGNNARLAIGGIDSDPNLKYIIKSSQGSSTASGLTFSAPNVDISGSFDWNGDLRSYLDWKWNEVSGTGKAIFWESKNGFQGSTDVDIGDFHLTASRTLNPGYLTMAFDFTGEGSNDIKTFSMNTEPNSFIQHVEWRILFGDKGILGRSIDNLWANNFWVQWDLIRMPPYWKWGGEIKNDIDPVIEVTEDGGANWDQIYPNPIGNMDPVADFTWAPQSPQVGEMIQFDASASYDPDGEITRYDWKWEASQTLWNNDLGPYPTHSYDQQGNYEVKVRVWDDGLINTDISSRTVPVGVQTGLDISINYEGNDLYEGEYFTVHVEDAETHEYIDGATVLYQSYDPESGSLIDETTGNTDSNGDAGFYAHEVEDDNPFHQNDCLVVVSKEGYAEGYEYFTVDDSRGRVNGYVVDINGDGIGGATVETNVGGYSTTTRSYPVQPVGSYELWVDPGQYYIIASKIGYDQGQSQTFIVEKGGNTQVPDITLQSGDGSILVTVLEYGTNSQLLLAEVSLDGGPNQDVDHHAQHLFSGVSPGTHTVTATCIYHDSDSKSVSVIEGQTADVTFYLNPVGEWVHPDGHSDPNNGWKNEYYAYDYDLYSFAESNPRYVATEAWTEDLILTHQTINCNQIKYNALYDVTHIRYVKIDVYYSGSWHNIFNGLFPGGTTTRIVKINPSNPEQTYPISEARIAFKIKGCVTGTTAELYDFQFYKVGQ